MGDSVVTVPPHLRLGVNVDHVATLRNARGGRHPDPVRAAEIAIASGADGITAHLREDRRHIRDEDIARLMDHIDKPLNLEMAATAEMVGIAVKTRPHAACIVPERREERTTEGGLDVAGQHNQIVPVVAKLKAAGIRVSLFIAPDTQQIDMAAKAGAPVIEIHVGTWCDAVTEGNGALAQTEFERIAQGAALARKHGIGGSRRPRARLHDRGNDRGIARRGRTQHRAFHDGRRAVFGIGGGREKNARGDGSRPPGRKGSSMIIGIGSDLIDIRRVEKVIDRHGERFLSRIFTDAERARAERRTKSVETYAKRFAAKEACSKALGTGIRRGVWWRDMGVVNLPGGKPTLQLTGGALKRLQALTPPGCEAHIDLTITDEYPMALAYVIISAVAATTP